MFSNRIERVIEWSECDPAGIVFYPRFFEMFDAATAALFEAASGLTRASLIRRDNILGWPMVQSAAEFHAPASFDDRVVIETEIVRVGRSSLEIRHRLFRGEILCVSATETRVWARHGAQPGSLVAEPVPQDLRSKLVGEKPETEQ